MTNIEEYKQKAEAGNAKAQSILGIIYYRGEEGVVKDFEKAFYWFDKAAQQGNAFALYRKGICYLEGKGVDSDIDKAMENITLAADKGDEDAAQFIRAIRRQHVAAVDRSDDPYRDARIKKERQEQKTLDKRFWFREVKINAMLIIIGIFLSIVTTFVFTIMFADRWTPDVLERRTIYVLIGTLFFSCFVLIVGRYVTKFVHKMIKIARKRK